MDWKQLGKAAKRAAASIEDAARKAAPHIEEAAAKAAAHIEEAAAKAKPHLEDAARKTRAAAKEVGKRIDRAEPGRDAVKRLLGGVLKDWLDGEIDWIDEDNESTAEAKPAGASIAVSRAPCEAGAADDECGMVGMVARALYTCVPFFF